MLQVGYARPISVNRPLRRKIAGYEIRRSGRLRSEEPQAEEQCQ